MAAARINLQGHIQSRGPIRVHQRGQAFELGVDRVGVTDEDIDWQPALHPGQRLRVEPALAQGDERGLGLGREADAAERVGDVFVHLGLVAAEPVVGRPLRRERRVEAVRADRRRTGGARQHQRVDQRRMVEQPGLREHRPHRVSEQDQRQAGFALADQPRQHRHVVHRRRRAAGSEVAEVAHAGGHAVAAMVGGVDHIAGVDERGQGLEVAHGVFAGAVGQLDFRSGLGRAAPTEAREACAVGALVAEAVIGDAHAGPRFSRMMAQPGGRAKKAAP